MHPIEIFVSPCVFGKVEWGPQPKGERMAKTMESSLPASQKPRVAKHQPTSEEIALRAYQIYLERGGTPGNELEDWIQAERELVGESGKVAGENGKSRRKATVKSAAA
jgi:Protein of unknown function (DUF2934)